MFTRRAPLLLCLLLAAPVAAGTSASEEPVARFAIVVGYNGGDDDKADLTFADDDAVRFFQQLEPGLERAWLLVTPDKETASAYGPLLDAAVQPTTRELARALGELSWLTRNARERGARTELVFFYAGHGDVSPGGEGYVLLADGPFSRTDLNKHVVQASPADVNHVIIDACAAYFMVSRGDAQSGRVDLRPELLDAMSDVPADERAAWQRTGVLVSTSEAKEVHESADIGGGVFSYLLRSALAGAGDVSGDGRVEYAEAAAFIAAASAGLADPRARLDVHVRAPVQRPNAPLADTRPRDDDRLLVVDARGGERVRLLDARGVPWIELRTEEGARPLIALRGSPFFIVQRGELEAVLVPRHAGAYSMSALRFDRAPRARDAGAGRFAGLFEVPFGQAFLSGFLAQRDFVPPRAGAAPDLVYAPSGEPPLRVPFWGLATTAYGVGGALLVASGAALAWNAVAFSQLRTTFDETGTLDPELSLQADTALTSGLVLGVGAVALLASGAGLSVVALDQEEP